MSVDTDFNEREKEAIEQLRHRMEGELEPDMHEDLYLFYRFLKGQEFDVNNAEAMLRKHLQWRSKNDIKNILNYKKPEVAVKYFPNIVLGYDKEGCLIRYSSVGSTDLIGLVNSIKFYDLEKILLHDTEYDTYLLKKKSEELGRNIDKCVYIYNMENFAFKTATNKSVICMYIKFICFFQDNYPERLKSAYFINCSVYFMMLLNILKKFMTGSVLSKIYTYNDESYKEDILKIIDADTLPAFLGGYRTDPDGNPLCHTFVNHGGPVPEKYYLRKNKRSLAGMPGVKSISLSHAAFHEECLVVKKPGSYLEWVFETTCRDIGFGVFYENVTEGDPKMIELIPHQRIDTEQCSETGTYLCQTAGKYVVLFDNTYSWIRSKEIFYRINIISPEEQHSKLTNETSF